MPKETGREGRRKGEVTGRAGQDRAGQKIAAKKADTYVKRREAGCLLAGRTTRTLELSGIVPTRSNDSPDTPLKLE